MVNPIFEQYEKALDAWYEEYVKDKPSFFKRLKRASRALFVRFCIATGSFAMLINLLQWITAYTENYSKLLMQNPGREDLISFIYGYNGPLFPNLLIYTITAILSGMFIVGFYQTVALFLAAANFTPYEAYEQRDWYKSKLVGMPVKGGLPIIKAPTILPQEKRPLIPIPMLRMKKKRKQEAIEPQEISPIVEKDYKNMVNDFLAWRDSK